MICLARGKFESAFVTEEQLCEILYPGEDIFEVAGLLVPHSTAMHALVDIAKVKRGQVSMNERFTL